MIRLVKRDKDGKVLAVSTMDIPRTITSFKLVSVKNPEFDETKAETDPEYIVPEFIQKTEIEEKEHPSVTSSLADGWEENYTDVLVPRADTTTQIDFDSLKAEFATATSARKIEIIAKLLRLV